MIEILRTHQDDFEDKLFGNPEEIKPEERPKQDITEQEKPANNGSNEFADDSYEKDDPSDVYNKEKTQHIDIPGITDRNANKRYRSKQIFKPKRSAK